MEKIQNILEYLLYIIKLIGFHFCIPIYTILFFILYFSAVGSIPLIILLEFPSIFGIPTMTILPIYFVIIIFIMLFLGMFPKIKNQSEKELNKLLFVIERKHALWIAKDYLQYYTDIRKNITLRNDNISVSLVANKAEMVICCDIRTGQKIKTRLKKHFRGFSRYIIWDYVDIWNKICINFDNETTFWDVLGLFKVNSKSSSYEAFCENYNSYKKFKSMYDQHISEDFSDDANNEREVDI